MMLTTKDNPYDPFTQYGDWFGFDAQKGYHSCALLGRIARTSPDLSDEENESEVERAIQEIIAYDPLGIYKAATNIKQGLWRG